MMKKIKTQELMQISGGNFSLTGGGGGNPGQYVAGNIGISYTPKEGGLGFSYSRNPARINGLVTFSGPASAMIAFIKKMVTARRLSVFVCVCLLSACGHFNGDGSTAASPYPAGKQLDPNCDHYATSGGGAEDCRPVGQGQPRDQQGRRIPL